MFVGYIYLAQFCISFSFFLIVIIMEPEGVACHIDGEKKRQLLLKGLR